MRLHTHTHTHTIGKHAANTHTHTHKSEPSDISRPPRPPVFLFLSCQYIYINWAFASISELSLSLYIMYRLYCGPRALFYRALFSLRVVKVKKERQQHVTEDPATGIEFELFLVYNSPASSSYSPAIWQKNPLGWRRRMWGWSARDFYKWYSSFFRFESQIASRFCCIEIGSYRFIRRCCWENASLLFYLFFSVFVVCLFGVFIFVSFLSETVANII